MKDLKTLHFQRKTFNYMRRTKMKKIRTLLYGFLIIMFLAAAMPTVAEAAGKAGMSESSNSALSGLTKVGQRL